MRIETLEVCGFKSAFSALRLPYGKETRSSLMLEEPCGSISDEDGTVVTASGYSIDVDPKDLALMQTLISRGDEHAKPLRGICAYCRIDAPIHFWGELETYGVGHQRLFSSSTMHDEGRGKSGLLLDMELEKISFAREVTKVDMFSYQTLRRIVAQRHNHRKSAWHVFIEWVRTLPLADGLILLGLDEQLAVHESMWKAYQDELKAWENGR